MAIKNAQHGLRTRGSYNVGIKFEGNWLLFNDLINNVDIRVLSAAAFGQRKFAEKYRDKVKNNIRTGGKRFGYKGHSSKYKSYKSRHGGPSKLLFWSGAMHNSVEIIGLPGGRLGVGIPKDAQREPYHGKEKNLLSVSEYANILEHGAYSRGIVKRPIFSDTFTKDMGGLNGLRKTMQFHIIRKFSQKGIIINKI